MAIVVTITRDPLAGPPQWQVAPPVILASSDAARELKQYMRRYCERCITGKSILIGGDRGTGKTTLVNKVIEELYTDPFLNLDSVPLFVPIHGPDLFGGYIEKEPIENKTSSPAPTVVVNYHPSAGKDGLKQGEENQSPKNEKNKACFAIKVLTIGLHRAFMTELGWRLEGRVPEYSEDHELVAQLKLNLDSNVDADELRWAWYRLGVIDRGVLGRDGVSARAKYYTNQGLLELVAATSLIDGFVRVTGRVEDSKTTATEAEIKQEIDSEKLKSLVNSITGLVAGGLTGAGIFFQPGVSGIQKAVLGAIAIPIAAFLATAFLNMLSTRTNSRKQAEEKKITFDKSLESLDLFFPLIVNRVLDSGRAPIFVIDELDKIENIDAELQQLIPRLKHLVADKAFFCFLVGRKYFEGIEQLLQNEPYSPESTFFARRLYASPGPDDWRAYLLGAVPPGQSTIEFLKANNVQALLTSSAPVGTGDRATEVSYLFRFSYYLLARTRMHALRIRRYIDGLANEDGTLRTPDLGRPENQNWIVYQAAVEQVLLGLASRIGDDHNFRQIIYDVLYYPLDLWEKGENLLISRETIRTYIEQRLNVQQIGMVH